MESDLIAESDRLRISAVFSADTQLDVRPCLFSELYSHLDQLSYAYLIYTLERIVVENTLIEVFRRRRTRLPWRSHQP